MNFAFMRSGYKKRQHCPENQTYAALGMKFKLITPSWRSGIKKVKV
jgi:hypothetical protein